MRSVFYTLCLKPARMHTLAFLPTFSNRGAYIARSSGNGDIHPGRPRPQLQQFPPSKTALSSLDERKSIADFLDKSVSRIDRFTEKTQRSIDLLKERRAAFITAAVTGQIDLREAA